MTHFQEGKQWKEDLLSLLSEKSTRITAVERISALAMSLISFKKIYALRTEAERYNSRFKSTGQERLWIHSLNAAKNMNSFAHIALLAVAVAAVVTKSACSYRSLKSVKRIA